MTARKLPRCATCGGSLWLRHTPGRLRMELLDLNGAPEVGWCRQHGPITDDAGARLLALDSTDTGWRDEAEAILAEIRARGEGRVVRSWR